VLPPPGVARDEVRISAVAFSIAALLLPNSCAPHDLAGDARFVELFCDENFIVCCWNLQLPFFRRDVAETISLCESES
jgi:hypothetical protein